MPYRYVKWCLIATDTREFNVSGMDTDFKTRIE